MADPTSRLRWSGIRPYVVSTIALAGLLVSGLLLSEHVSPGLCGPDGGCAQVQGSTYASWWGIPLPVFGLAFFGSALGVLALGVRGRRIALAITAVGGVAGLGLIALQAFVLQTFCPYCLVVDLSAVTLAIAVALRGTELPDIPAGHRRAVLGAAALVVIAPLAMTLRPENATAPPSTSLHPILAASEEPGKVTVVEFIDFECPFCRRQHAVLEELKADHPDLRVVRFHKPLPSHRHAAEAARVACCAEALGAGDAVADALFRADDLSPGGCREVAAAAGLEPAALEQCLASSQPRETLEEHRAAAEALGVRGIPTLFIGGQRLEGLQSREVLEARLEAVRAPRS
ncbi:MAG: thioredoxin domain-containing protein [Myxococcota bacterium]